MIKQITTINPIEIQTESFKTLLLNKLCDLKLNNLNLSKFKLKINTNKIKYSKPKYDINTCIEKNKTYSIGIYLPIKILYKNKEIILYNYFFIGELPLITKGGFFIINGNKRIIAEYIKRPGLYVIQKDNCILATIIPEKGNWITIKMNDLKQIFFRFDNSKRKLPFLIFLSALGLSRKKLFNSIIEKKLLLENLTKEKLKSSKNSLEILSIILYKKKLNFETRENLYNRLINKNYFKLGENGRNNLNNKLYHKKYFKIIENLLPEDLLGVLNLILNKELTLYEKNFDDIDDIMNKSIKTIGEALQENLEMSINKLKNDINKKILKSTILGKKKIKLNKDKIKEFFNSQIITLSFKNFFNLNPLSQISEEINSIAETTQKRKIVLNKTNKNSSNKTSSLKIREIHYSHYGKICPVETSEGKNVGLIWSLAKEARINQLGFIETPFYLKIKKKNKLFFTYLNKNYEDIRKKNSKQSNFPILSIGTSLIPYLEHNDANRTLMGANMQRQAIPLIFNDVPIIGTSLEKLIASLSDKNKTCIKSGRIKFISQNKIIIHEDIISFYNIKNKTKAFLKKMKRKLKTLKYKKYKIRKYFNFINKNNQYYYKRSQIKNKNWLQKGNIFSRSNETKHGNLSLGRNILIAYITWKGYNFEDAIIINEKLIEKDIFTSMHIKKYKTYLLKNEIEEEKLTKNIKTLSKKYTRNLKKNGIIKTGSFVKENEIIIGKLKYQKITNVNEKLINIIFGQKPAKNNALLIPKNNEGTVIGTKILKKKTLTIIIYILTQRKLQLGDKISGRHGNKGIVCKILKKENMPFLQDGTIVEIILNPLGIPSRMNLGQLFESLIGFCGKNLKERYNIFPFDENKGNNISIKNIYNKLYEAKKKTKKIWIFNLKNPGKIKIFDGKTAMTYSQEITVGYSYIIKLMHIAHDKITARSQASYSLITKQPLKGKAKNGGQRFGEMEIWSLEGYGSAFSLQEILTIKSDDLINRLRLLYYIVDKKDLAIPQLPEATKVFILELRAACITLNLNSIIN
uniref:DNA-directed RNA polymerase subunit beta n=1 Tax=Phacus orbicularis TaxID=158829 RepID=A0A182B0V9_9EUGL|nr:RNA polymerase beta subunit [Phacus orbicularis]